ncbi:MAG: flagellar hook-length control protein FliK [Phycisphaerales bacterium]|nr:flagellar hook-length control protein FliK [Phycisphaerales bacterium]
MPPATPPGQCGFAERGERRHPPRCAPTRTARAVSSAAQTSGDTAAEPAKLPDTASQVARDVTATGQFTTPSGQHQAPGQEVAGANAQSLVTAIRHNSDWSRMLGDPVARLTQRTGPGGVNMDVLKIDLHPASLGRMEASLKAHGDRMSITITVSSRDAAASIGNDIAGIQAGLRAAGYTVDQVTVEVRGQSGNPSGWAASQQDTSAGGFARGGGRQQQMEAPDNGFASLRSGRTGDETVRSPGSAYVI